MCKLGAFVCDENPPITKILKKKKKKTQKAGTYKYTMSM